MFKRMMLYLLVLIITVTAFSPNFTVFAQKLKSNDQIFREHSDKRATTVALLSLL